MDRRQGTMVKSKDSGTNCLNHGPGRVTAGLISTMELTALTSQLFA